MSGFKVSAFSCPSALLSTAIPSSSACLIFDIYLPEMTGIELYQSLAALGCQCPLVLITAHLDDATRVKAEQAHPVAVLIKPFSRDSLIAAIRQSHPASPKFPKAP